MISKKRLEKNHNVYRFGKNVLIALIIGGFLWLLACEQTERSKGTERVSDNASPTQVRNQKMSTSELKKLYRGATSEIQRRNVCLEVIDSGAIIRTGPVATVDEIFSTDFAKNLPTKQEIRKTGVVDFDVQTESTAKEMAEATGHKGWFLAIEYDFNGEIQNYYLTNLHK
jgi:hypothetical protein